MREECLTYTGPMRVHFNRHGAAPFVWCVSVEGSWEIAVSNIEISTAIRTAYRPKTTPDEDDGKPSAWLETYGRLSVYANGIACIDGAE